VVSKAAHARFPGHLGKRVRVGIPARGVLRDRQRLLRTDVRDDRAAAADFVRDRGLTYPSIFDNPGRSLLALRGFPRNTVPFTIVLDREHRVAAVFLTALRVSELLPVVQRVAAEAPLPVGVPS